MAKIKEAQNRLFKNIFVCKKCKTKKRSIPQRVIEKKVKCRRCGSKDFRPLRKIKTAAK